MLYNPQQQSGFFWHRLRIIAALIYIPAGIFAFLAIEHPARSLVFVGYIFIAARLKLWFDETRNTIDFVLRKGVPNSVQFNCYTIDYPQYQFADLYRAAEHLLGSRKDIEKVLSTHFEGLSQILNRQFFTPQNRTIQPPARLAWQISLDEEIYLPCDMFWHTPAGTHAGNGGNRTIVRLRFDQNSRKTILEVATEMGSSFEDLKSSIELWARENSVYRGKLISFQYEQQVTDQYGDNVLNGQMSVKFIQSPNISEEDIILTDAIRTTIRRNVTDFFSHASQLSENGLPNNRGLLFYGPPGTGKTFTSKYIFNQLSGVSAIVAAGQALIHIKSICNFARVIQPSLVILEDIDLVFSSRQTNLYSTVLGDLMDELDGFARKDKTVFILTTNDIERLESAIRDRPGRISQCIYFGLPGKALREKYLLQILKPFDAGALDISGIAEKLDGASQAFLTELVMLSGQLSLERQGYIKGAKIALQQQDIDDAMQMMVQDNNHHSNSILGLQKKIL